MRRLLDLFSGAGGAAVGYHQAGFTEITGVDNRPMPRYPFRFVQADALEFLASVKPWEYDLIHASPPCQRWSAATPGERREDHPDMVSPSREMLRRLGTPYVIENVPGAPLQDPLLLCGLMFGLRVFRHRLFETSDFMLQPPHAGHRGRRIGVNGFCTVAGGGNSGLRDRSQGRNIRRHPEDGVQGWRDAMGVEWMSRDELAQAIPPAYTRWLGEQLR